MNKVRKIIIVTIFLLLMIVTTIILYGIDQKNNQYILIIDDERISLDKYVTYSRIIKYNIEEEYIEKNGLTNVSTMWNGELYGFQAVEYLKNQIIDTLIKYEICSKKFNELELEISQERLEDIEGLLQLDTTQKQMAKMNVTENEYRQYLLDKEKYDAVYNYITENMVLSDSEANKYINQNNYGPIYVIKRIMFSTRDQNTMAQIYTDEQIKKIYEKAQEALEKLESESFDKVSLEYSDSTTIYKPGDEYILIEGNSENKKLEEVAKKLELGAHSDIFESTLGYEIIELERVIYKDDELYLSEVKKIMSTSKKEETFSKEYDKWYRLSNINKNNSVINNIKII